jgi:hypothetical protein
MRRKLAALISNRALLTALTISAAIAKPEKLAAQTNASDSTANAALISSAAARAADSLRTRRRRFTQVMTIGFVTSVLAHESGHFIAGYAIGAHPHLGLAEGRPTIFSGINEHVHTHKQFVFSAAGLTVQQLVDELVLDIPHSRGGAFERGILAGGIGTTLFYTTIGRNSSVSDISVMARTSSLSKTKVSLIFGGFSALHTLRIVRNGRYAHFFALPSEQGVKMGVSLRSD